MKVAIHQPNFLPWMGYFYKISRCDTFVMLDDVQFTKGGFQNRNRIKTANGVLWLTVPVLTKERSGQRTDEVLTNDKLDWRKKHWQTLALSYAKAPHFKKYNEAFAEIYSRAWPKLVDLNEALIRLVLDLLDIRPQIVKASELKVAGDGTERLVAICKQLGADKYISGFGGQNYQDPAQFDAAGIALDVYKFKHPVYPQLWGEFEPSLSVIDLLFNCGDASRDIILNSAGELI